MKKLSIFLFLLQLTSFSSLAQELLPPDVENDFESTENVGDDFYSDTDFDGDEEPPTSDDSFFPEENETNFDSEVETTVHNVRIEFNSTVSFLNVDDPSPYLEINYSTLIESSIELNQKNNTYEVMAVVDVQTNGSLAQNELFNCRLDISFQETKARITTKINSVRSKLNNELGEERPQTLQAVFRSEISESMTEDWFSFCTDVTGSTLNTVGAPENYNLQVLKMIDPSLKSIVLENFNPYEEYRVPLNVPRQVILDEEINNNISFSGEGIFIVSPQ